MLQKQPQEVFCKKAFVRNFAAKFTGKRFRQGLWHRYFEVNKTDAIILWDIRVT